MGGGAKEVAVTSAVAPLVSSEILSLSSSEPTAGATSTCRRPAELPLVEAVDAGPAGGEEDFKRSANGDDVTSVLLELRRFKLAALVGVVTDLRRFGVTVLAAGATSEEAEDSTTGWWVALRFPPLRDTTRRGTGAVGWVGEMYDSLQCVVCLLGVTC